MAKCDIVDNKSLIEYGQIKYGQIEGKGYPSEGKGKSVLRSDSTSTLNLPPTSYGPLKEVKGKSVLKSDSTSILNRPINPYLNKNNRNYDFSRRIIITNNSKSKIISFTIQFIERIINVPDTKSPWASKDENIQESVIALSIKTLRPGEVYVLKCVGGGSYGGLFPTITPIIKGAIEVSPSNYEKYIKNDLDCNKTASTSN